MPFYGPSGCADPAVQRKVGGGGGGGGGGGNFRRKRKYFKLFDGVSSFSIFYFFLVKMILYRSRERRCT